MTRMDARAPTALVLGDVNLDFGLGVEHYPREGDDAQASSCVMGSGGGGLNAAVAMASLGARAILLSRVGADCLASAALHTAHQRGVDLSAVQVDPIHCTGTCTVVTSAGGERTLFSHRGANAYIDPGCVQSLPVADCALVYLSAYSLLEGPSSEVFGKLIARAVEGHVPIAMDVGLAVVRRRRAALLGLLEAIGLLSVNEPELEALSGQAEAEAGLRWVQQRAPCAVLLKRGSRGLTLSAGGKRVDCAACELGAVDSTGCGDGCAAVCALGWAGGLGAEGCARLGNAMGGLIATRRGAADSIPAREELTALVGRDVACWLERKGGKDDSCVEAASR